MTSTEGLAATCATAFLTGKSFEVARFLQVAFNKHLGAGTSCQLPLVQPCILYLYIVFSLLRHKAFKILKCVETAPNAPTTIIDTHFLSRLCYCLGRALCASWPHPPSNPPDIPGNRKLDWQ